MTIYYGNTGVAKNWKVTGVRIHNSFQPHAHISSKWIPRILRQGVGACNCAFYKQTGWNTQAHYLLLWKSSAPRFMAGCSIQFIISFHSVLQQSRNSQACNLRRASALKQGQNTTSLQRSNRNYQTYFLTKLLWFFMNGVPLTHITSAL